MCVPCTQVVFNIISFPLPVFFWGPVASTYMECRHWCSGDRAVISSRCSINPSSSFPVLSYLPVKYTETAHT